MLQQPVLELINLSKVIKQKTIVQGINLTMQPAEILGFLGPNGAGKTTTIRMLVGLIKPTTGQVKICGYSVQENFIQAMSNVGCIIESPEMYKFLTGLENLLQFARMDKRISRSRVDEVVELVGLQNRINDKVSTYSLGMRQRLGIAQALLSRPKLLILDEPTNGLDPAGINEFRNLIKYLASEEQMAIFVSSHLLAEVQQMCDRVAIIKQGSLVQVAEVQDLLNSEVIRWELNEPERAVQLLQERWGITALQESSTTVTAAIGAIKLEEINRVLAVSDVGLRYSQPRQHTLEELFLELTEGSEIL